MSLRADFVIGNPPYIRLEDIPEETASAYRDAYPTMRGRAELYVIPRSSKRRCIS